MVYIKIIHRMCTLLQRYFRIELHGKLERAANLNVTMDFSQLCTSLRLFGKLPSQYIITVSQIRYQTMCKRESDKCAIYLAER